MDYTSAAATSETEIGSAYNEVLAAGSQAIFISGDNLLTHNCRTLVDLGIKNSIPVFSTDMSASADGALASLSIDYNKLCKSTGDVVVSVIRGQNPDDLPLQHFATDIISINTTTAKTLGITIPADILENADYILK
jgi:putative ABC transport system substrate-binding protein